MYITNGKLHEEIMSIAQQIEVQQRSEDSRRQWEALLQRFLTTDETGVASLSNLDMNSVSYLTHAGWRLQMQYGNYARASQLLDLYFDHPDIAQVEEGSQAMMVVHHAMSHLCAGETIEALRLIRATFQTNDRKTLKFRIRTVVYGLTFYYLPVQDRNAVVSPELIDLANEMSRLWKNKQRPPGLLAAGATFGQLSDFLNSNIPR